MSDFNNWNRKIIDEFRAVPVVSMLRRIDFRALHMLRCRPPPQRLGSRRIEA